MSNVSIKLLREGAKLPTRGSAFAAGYDIYACLDGQETVTVIGSELQSMTEKTLEDLTEMETEVESEVSKQEAPEEQETSS